MKVSFISLGCDKNRVNTEQMMAMCLQAGMTVQEDVNGSDVVVINTCGFIDSAKTEAIETILSAAELKAAGEVKKILVTGCLSQRYRDEMLTELPEIDGMMGTADYGDIVSAVEQVMAGEDCTHFSDINGAVEELPRVLSTPTHFAYLRIAEGCSNSCAYCIIPKLRGRYRSRAMEDILTEARALAADGVKECIVIAQDITRYGVDLYHEKKLPELLRELCKLDFHWIRLHYLYPDTITDELIDTIAAEEKVLPYLDIPIQHCNDAVLKAMRRRETHAGLLALMLSVISFLTAPEYFAYSPELVTVTEEANGAVTLSFSNEVTNYKLQQIADPEDRNTVYHLEVWTSAWDRAFHRPGVQAVTAAPESGFSFISRSLSTDTPKAPATARCASTAPHPTAAAGSLWRGFLWAIGCYSTSPCS